MAGDFFEAVPSGVLGGVVVDFSDSAEAVGPKLLKCCRSVSVYPFGGFEEFHVVEGTVEQTSVIVGSAKFAVFATVEISDFLREVLAKSFDKLLKVLFA